MPPSNCIARLAGGILDLDLIFFQAYDVRLVLIRSTPCAFCTSSGGDGGYGRDRFDQIIERPLNSEMR